MDTLVIFGLVVVVSFALSSWVWRAQKEYYRVRSIVGEAGPLERAGVFEHYVRSPLAWLRNIVPLWSGQVRVLTTPQVDPRIEAARGRYNRRQNIAGVFYLFGLAAILWSALSR